MGEVPTGFAPPEAQGEMPPVLMAEEKAMEPEAPRRGALAKTKELFRRIMAAPLSILRGK